MINHIVLFKLKEGVKGEQLDDCLNAIKGLEEKISGIIEVSGGYDNSPEHKNNGYVWGFIVRFENAQARDNYVSHSEHQKVIEKYIAPIVEDVLVFNYSI